MTALPPRSLLSTLRAALVVALITVFVLALAYQVRSRVVVDLGGKWDAPFVARFFDAEADTRQSYRWTRGQSRIELEGQALATPWTLRVRINAYRPSGTVPIQVQMNGVTVDRFEAHDGWEIYDLEGNVAADAWTGDNIILLTNDTFVPQRVIPGSTDSRRLGVASDWLELTPARSETAMGSDDLWIDFGTAPILPPLGVLLSWAGALGLLYVTGRGIGLPYRGMNLAFALLIFSVGLAFALARPYIGYYTAGFLVLALVLSLLGFALWLLVPRFAAYLDLTLDRSSLAAVCAILLLSIGLKWGGAWYPQFRSSDLLFHAHRLEFVSHGEMFFTSELPDAARRIVPYPPALYVVLAPFTVFRPDFSTLLTAFDVLADALAILTLYFAARKLVQQTPLSGDGTRYALLATFLFAFNPVSFYVYSWGNHTNIFGQDIATILFALLLVLNPLRPRHFVLLLFLCLLAVTTHLGIFLSFLVFFPLAILLRFLLRDRDARRDSAALAVLFGLGLTVAAALYYLEFSDTLLLQTQAFLSDLGAGRAGGRGGGVTLARAGDVARYTAEQFGWILCFAGLAAVPLAFRRLTLRARVIWSAWLIVGVIFALITLGASFSTRYTLWATPALALSGALLLLWFEERVRGAQIAVYALCGFALAQTLWLWFDRVWNAYH